MLLVFPLPFSFMYVYNNNKYNGQCQYIHVGLASPKIVSDGSTCALLMAYASPGVKGDDDDESDYNRYFPSNSMRPI